MLGTSPLSLGPLGTGWTVTTAVSGTEMGRAAVSATFVCVRDGINVRVCASVCARACVVVSATFECVRTCVCARACARVRSCPQRSVTHILGGFRGSAGSGKG